MGLRIPLVGANKQAREHEFLLIFPESLCASLTEVIRDENDKSRVLNRANLTPSYHSVEG